MKKKEPFLPSLKKKGFMEAAMNLGIQTLDHKDPYRNHGLKMKLMAPTRNSDSTKLFKMIKTTDGEQFNRPIGREIDVFDQVLVKYFGNPDRSVIKPKRDENGDFAAPSKTETKKWTPNNFIAGQI
jgi:hypothetical protein